MTLYCMLVCQETKKVKAKGMNSFVAIPALLQLRRASSMDPEPKDESERAMMTVFQLKFATKDLADHRVPFKNQLRGKTAASFWS